jgi:hypothetical protein
MLGGELRVEQREPPFPQPLDEIDETNLRRIRAP